MAAHMEIQWHLTRADENDDMSAGDAECLFEIEGLIRCDGIDAGEVRATYVFSEDPASDDAFLWLWDLTAEACAIWGEIMLPSGGGLRRPLPDFLAQTTGVLCVHYIALKPAFRSRGLGREVMHETVCQFADSRVGVVLLDTVPLQHRPKGYDDFFDEVRELPFNEPETDQARLIRHFESWGMVRVPRTRYLAAAPTDLCAGIRPDWYPGLLEG